MLITIAGTLFGWGMTWGVLNTKVNNQYETIIELKEYKAEAERENTQQEIKINLNADGIGDVNDILRDLIWGSRPPEGEGQEED